MEPYWAQEAGEWVCYDAEGVEFGRVAQIPTVHGQTGFAWHTMYGESGTAEGFAAAKRELELAYLRKYHPERFRADHEVQAGDAGKGGEK